MDDVKSHLESNAVDKAKSSLSEGTSMLSERQKLILLADKSEFGWKTVEQYTQHELADNEEDGKKIRRAEERAEKALKSTTSKRPVNQSSSLSRLPVPHALLPSIPKVLRHLVPSVISAIGYLILGHPTFRQGQVIVSSAAGLAIGGPNALKSLDLFLKVFQVTDNKTVTNKVSLNFHLLLSCVISLNIYQWIPFKNLRTLSLSWKSHL